MTYASSFDNQRHVEESPTFKDWEEFKKWEESLPVMQPLNFPEEEGYFCWEDEEEDEGEEWWKVKGT